MLTEVDGSLNLWQITFADAATSEWSFSGAGVSFGGTVALNDGLKGSFSIKLATLPTEFANY